MMKLLANMDWELFDKQKQWLHEQVCRLELSGTGEAEHPEGLLNLMDQIGDLAEDLGIKER